MKISQLQARTATPPTTRADNRQHQGATPKQPEGRGVSQISYTGRSKKGKRRLVVEDYDFGSDRNFEDRNCFATPGFHLYQCRIRIVAEALARTFRASLRYFPGVPCNENIPHREASCQEDIQKYFAKVAVIPISPSAGDIRNCLEMGLDGVPGQTQ